jgi:hypothetical protein
MVYGFSKYSSRILCVKSSCVAPLLLKKKKIELYVTIVKSPL